MWWLVQTYIFLKENFPSFNSSVWPSRLSLSVEAQCWFSREILKGRNTHILTIISFSSLTMCIHFLKLALLIYQFQCAWANWWDIKEPVNKLKLKLKIKIKIRIRIRIRTNLGSFYALSFIKADIFFWNDGCQTPTDVRWTSVIKKKMCFMYFKIQFLILVTNSVF